jgi:dihydrofolate reductase
MFRHIVACDRQRGMAKHGYQPWHITHDEQYFLDETAKYGSNCLMGRRTFEIIGHPLAGRNNFIASRDTYPQVGEATLVTDLDYFLQHFKGDLWIIGGASIFEQTLHFTDELLVTYIDADFGCDQFYPDYTDGFELASESELHEENGFVYSYRVYKRRLTTPVH